MRLSLRSFAALSVVLAVATQGALAREFKGSVSEIAQIEPVKPKYPVPKEPNMLFYIERSVNSNTVVYAANIDPQGHFDTGEPVGVYWRWYNVDGHKKPLNFIERAMAYGVRVETPEQGKPVEFEIAALPERKLQLTRDEHGEPEALIEMGNHLARLVYVYLHVDDSGLMPDVPMLDLFGIDKQTGKALHEVILKQ
jgi:uncharacterized protein DUF4833